MSNPVKKSFRGDCLYGVVGNVRCACRGDICFVAALVSGRFILNMSFELLPPSLA